MGPVGLGLCLTRAKVVADHNPRLLAGSQPWALLQSARQLNTTWWLNATLWLTIETLWLNITLWLTNTLWLNMAL